MGAVSAPKCDIQTPIACCLPLLFWFLEGIRAGGSICAGVLLKK